MDNLNKYIPYVTKRGLLFVAGMAWLGTSGFLIISGISNIIFNNTALAIRLGIAIPTGLLIYFLQHDGNWGILRCEQRTGSALRPSIAPRAILPPNKNTTKP